MKKNLRNLLLAVLAAGVALVADGCKPKASQAESSKRVASKTAEKAPETSDLGASQDGSSKSITFKTAEKAPETFDAWTFFWKAPGRNPDATLDLVVTHPDGRDFKFDFTRLPVGATGRSDWHNGIADERIRAAGDPTVFQGQQIEVSFRVSKGDLLLPADKTTFKFAFYKKAPDGKVDWKNPFKTIAALIER